MPSNNSLLTDASRRLDQLDRPIWIVTSGTSDQRGGLVATFVSSASIVPAMPRVVVGIARQHHTWSIIEACDAFALHLVSDEQLDLVWRFGLTSGQDVDKFADIDSQVGRTGVPLLPQALAAFECRVEARLPTGDRTLYLAEVVQFHDQSSADPLTMRRLIELASPSQLDELRALRDRDIAIDEAAIAQWRHDTGRLREG